MPRKQVLIVDDEEDNLDVLSLMLKDHFEVTSCASCSQALQAVVESPPDIVLMDIAMVHVDGVECLEKMRALPGLDALPAIAVTAYAYPKDKARFLASGFQAFIGKPIYIDEVLKAIDELLK
jgi:CheY-like chemotaxis protein